MASPSTLIRYKPVDPQVTLHPTEHRGFVEVPLDYASPADPRRLQIFYRLVPAYGSQALDSNKPVVVVINGGPGIPSSYYRPLDDTQIGPFDRFKYILKTHRVLLIDQRGTDGSSAPLDLSDPQLDAAVVARYFSSDSHARDTLAVIQHLIPEIEPFYMIAQSYGGMPGMQYLALSDRRWPAGIIFSSSALPYEETVPSMLARRQEQLRLNLLLRAAVPDIQAKLKRAREHLKSLTLDPDQINGLFSFLGKGPSPEWETAFSLRLDQMLGQTREQILRELSENLGDVNLLNYILSSCNLTPGQTDRGLASVTSELIPFEPWMVDENWVMQQAGQDGSWRGDFVETIDLAPPAPTPIPSLEELREAISRTRVLFTAAEGDAFVPAENYLISIQKFLVPGHTEVKTLPGGHSAIFMEKGYETLLAWAGH